MGHITNRLNSMKDLFRQNSITSVPSDATYNGLAPGYTTMQLRRTFGSKKRALNAGVIRARNTNPVPTVPTPLVNQTGSVTVALTNYTFVAFADADGQALTYTAALSSGAALPAWLVFNPVTRTFSGTPPGGSAGVYTIVVTGTDPFGASISDDFTLTIS